MKAIIACNSLSYIGLNNELPWRCSEDLKHFKRLTKGGNLLVGWNTYNGLPALPDRELIIDYRGTELLDDTIIEEINWCVGGRRTYQKYCHLFTELHISHIDNNTVGDTMFPNLSGLNPECKIFNYYFK